MGARQVMDGTMAFASTQIGTPYYMSPELFKNKVGDSLLGHPSLSKFPPTCHPCVRVLRACVWGGGEEYAWACLFPISCYLCPTPEPCLSPTPLLLLPHSRTTTSPMCGR